jgi:putative transposase
MRQLETPNEYPVAVMCKALEVSRSGYYAWRDRPPSARAREDERLGVAIRAAHTASRHTYGTRRVQAELRDQGFDIGRDRIGRLRRQMGLRCKQRRRFKVTTDSNHALPVADNVLQQRFEADAPDRVWLTDLTYIATDEGWLYLAGIKDLYTCEIVGYAMDGRMTQQLTQQALFRAVKARRPACGLIHHGDRGSQYCAHDYRRMVESFGMRASMSRRGNCFDNAPMESFWGSLKTELVHHRRFATRAEAKASITEWIEVFYNRQRRHSRLGNLAPAVFARQFYNQARAA